jgi:hypothetical protein
MTIYNTELIWSRGDCGRVLGSGIEQHVKRL